MRPPPRAASVTVSTAICCGACAICFVSRCIICACRRVCSNASMARKFARPRRYLVIMAKSPRLGLVKRRLGAEIGDVAALRFYRNCLNRTCLRLGFDPRWQTLLSVTPDRDLYANDWPRDIPRMAQGTGDLGQRMHRIFAGLPIGEVIIVGSDIPAIEPRHVAHAFHLLGRADAVFGPATD